MQSDALHSAIMNLPIEPLDRFTEEERFAYLAGHRDARHLAAEFVRVMLCATELLAVLPDRRRSSRAARPVRRIVCAAIRAPDGEVLLGVRHYSADMHRQIECRRDGEKFAHRHDEDQGFVDQHGAFLTREEAYVVAQAAGQIVRPQACGEGLKGPKLYSEGLY
jgi:hypothetical protein